MLLFAAIAFVSQSPVANEIERTAALVLDKNLAATVRKARSHADLAGLIKEGKLLATTKDGALLLVDPSLVKTPTSGAVDRLRTLLRGKSGFVTLKPSELEPADRQAVVDILAAGPSGEGAFDVALANPEFRIGMYPTLSCTVKNGDREVKFSFSQGDNESSTAELVTPNLERFGSAEHVRDKEGKQVQPPRDVLNRHRLRQEQNRDLQLIVKGAYLDNLETASLSAAVSVRYTELAEEERERHRKLMRQAAAEALAGDLTPGEAWDGKKDMALSSLQGEAREDFAKQFLESYAINGFRSPEEAARFLNGANLVQCNTDWMVRVARRNADAGIRILGFTLSAARY